MDSRTCGMDRRRGDDDELRSAQLLGTGVAQLLLVILV